MELKITPFLWFDNRADEAAAFYHSIFNTNSAVLKPSPNAPAVPFELAGQPFVALNGNPGFAFTEAVSFLITCKDQPEVDYYWTKLTEGGQEQQCGWLKDKFGVSWQVIPAVLPQYLQDKDRAKANNALQSMLTMKKIDVAKLQQAYSS
jgi:predicted 3-demethylubiquinone-9 3-methyltransferase (glyoxalase superfamily)